MVIKIIRILGIIILLAAFAANLQYAFQNYGLSYNMLAQPIIDQTNIGSSMKLK